MAPATAKSSKPIARSIIIIKGHQSKSSGCVRGGPAHEGLNRLRETRLWMRSFEDVKVDMYTKERDLSDDDDDAQWPKGGPGGTPGDGIGIGHLISQFHLENPSGKLQK
ncbi:unnamed protein product [Clonostachys byssicola]|uniref:Uncharacterized protein n=1 Tax=Clonostachys byssicola TaxID=160290 RepID=A0A9N9UW26_9HYPO|nr:unnamed protein product [Clonostachys byssicola]